MGTTANDSASSEIIMTTSRAKILLQGDSLTQLCWEGWGAHLANVYQRRADVVARGYGGYNTRMYLRLPFDPTLTNGDVALAVLFLGANDSGLPELAAHHHVPIPEYKANLKILIERLRDQYKLRQNNNHILLISPTPVHHEQRFKYQKVRYGDKATGVLERTLENTQNYVIACQEVAKEEDLPFLNLYQTMLDDGDDWGRFLNDGLHFSAAGHEFVGKAVVKAINEAFPELAVIADSKTGQWCNSGSTCTGLPNHGGPFHDEIDNDDPDKAFQPRARNKRKEPAASS
eukprot:CAMPEP_0198145478 /NCGR_PEP_ID=MMETSP1443-20131203/23782_1 /TAXON_ID=186043 /ORGANISM="Entomoneis sp., Strain CCMP2396" /LENGTH=287 /DNA_ID=CAMNT_0043809143 /DNA_START=51 /DNA_END=914 /DNA_ORIENTATION=-